ncbi:MAG TPA: hypothetical protein PLH98_21350, partial [Ruminococcus flavefaciens]|nr:hypothetical protein [Ruminococcus flavefaciens]
LIHKVDEDGKVKYFWIDTGLEYSATKEHLDYLEQKYGITIERVKPDKPIPTCVKQYGVPFLSKYVSEQMMRLQAHGFQWEDEPLEVLLQRYPRCKTALQWWCGERYSDKDGVQKISRFSIYRNRFLKEFIMANPPDFPISNKCCEYSKKKAAKRIIKEHDADLDITGIRQAEGGIRSAAFKTCFQSANLRDVILFARSFGTRTAISVIMSRCLMLRTPDATQNTVCVEQAVSAVLSVSTSMRSLRSLRNMSRICIRLPFTSSASLMNIQLNTVLLSRR